MTRSALVTWACVVLAACGGGGGGIDGGPGIDGGSIDAPTPAADVAIDRAAPPEDVADDRGDAPSCELPMTDGCPCSDPGYTTCIGGYGTQCCGGRWTSFADGPCWPPPDAGAPTCDTPEHGCPCATEGEIHCRFYQWRLRCTEGTWLEDYGHVCC